jgi:hypothetical protein
VSPLAGHRLIDVVIADIDDPPREPRQLWPDPGLPPV